MSRSAAARIALFALAGTAWAIAACSLTSTSGLSDGASVAPEGDASATDAPLPEAAAKDAGRDAAKDPSLVAEYSFEDPFGTANAHDSSGNEKEGLVQGDATFVTDGVRGHALSVGGTGFFVVNGLSGALFPRSGTLSLWFRYDFAPSSSAGRSVFDNWDKSRSHLFVRVPDNSSIPGQFQMALQPPNAAGDYAAVVGFVPARNKWVHVVVTWDETAGQGAFYADGVLLRRQTYEMAFVPTEQLFRMGEGLVGAIDEVRLFRRDFSDAEALALD